MITTASYFEHKKINLESVICCFLLINSFGLQLWRSTFTGKTKKALFFSLNIIKTVALNQANLALLSLPKLVIFSLWSPPLQLCAENKKLKGKNIAMKACWFVLFGFEMLSKTSVSKNAIFVHVTSKVLSIKYIIIKYTLFWYNVVQCVVVNGNIFSSMEKHGQKGAILAEDVSAGMDLSRVRI